jgi:hypothetical protein
MKILFILFATYFSSFSFAQNKTALEVGLQNFKGATFLEKDLTVNGVPLAIRVEPVVYQFNSTNVVIGSGTRGWYTLYAACKALGFDDFDTTKLKLRELIGTYPYEDLKKLGVMTVDMEWGWTRFSISEDAVYHPRLIVGTAYGVGESRIYIVESLTCARSAHF